MSNVSVDKHKLDVLATAISNKSGVPLTLTLTEMVEAVDGIQTGGGGGQPSLQTKTVTYTPTTSQQTATITADTGYDGLEEVDVTVNAVPIMSQYSGDISQYFHTENNQRKWSFEGIIRTSQGGMVNPGASFGTGEYTYNAVPANTTITPTTSSQTVGGANYMMEGAVTVSAMPTGTAGTPTATKGSVSNHSVTVTPSVTNQTGYITGSTKTGTAVTVSASELVSGSETKTANGTYDVTNLASLVVNVAGGASNFMLLGTQTVGNINTTSTTATDTGVSITVKGVYAYDLLVCECSVNTKTNGRHAATTRLCWLTASSAVATKDGGTFASATWNCKLSSNGTATTRSSTTMYGVYANGITLSAGSTGDNGQAVIPIYRRYNNTQTGTINGSYTMRVYGVKIYDLIGG